MKLTRAQLDAMPEKTKKHAAVVQLYLDHDFLTAYAKHTDMRVSEDGYRAAVGAAHDWERHGELQFKYLLSHGLKPTHRVLEIGCGTGRLARKLVPYLRPTNYVGVEISHGAVAAARDLAHEEGWARHMPAFYHDIARVDSQFEFIWSFSVFIHLPEDVMTGVMREARRLMSAESVFLFSYVPERADARTGLKQFRHTLQTYTRAARNAGLCFERVHDWPGEQRLACARRI